MTLKKIFRAGNSAIGGYKSISRGSAGYNAQQSISRDPGIVGEIYATREESLNTEIKIYFCPCVVEFPV